MEIVLSPASFFLSIYSILLPGTKKPYLLALWTVVGGRLDYKAWRDASVLGGQVFGQVLMESYAYLINKLLNNYLGHPFHKLKVPLSTENAWMHN